MLTSTNNATGLWDNESFVMARSIDDWKRHQKELQEQLLLYAQLTEAHFTSSPGSQPSSLAPKASPCKESGKRPAKRPLAEVRDWTDRLELDGSKVRWTSPEPKRQRLDNVSHAGRKAKAPATIKWMRYDQVRSNAIKDGHWDTVVEWPRSSGQFWVLFCAQHNMHFKTQALIAAAKHVNGSEHKAPNKDYSTALIEIGYYISDCNEERARIHNAEVQEKLDRGYQPSNRFAGRKKAENLDISDVASSKPPQPQPSERTKRQTITKPKPFHVYHCYFEKQYWACLILDWDEQIAACPFDTLEETQLFLKRAQPPQCYNRTNKKIIGWAEGYEDGGPKVHHRNFPIMYFDGQNNVGWAPASHLSKMDLTVVPKGEQYPETSYHEARQWIATAAGYKTWEEYRASGVEIRKPTPVPMSEGQPPVLQPTKPPSDSSESEFDEILEGLREKGGDDTDDEDYQDDGRGFKGGRPPAYVIEYEDDEWTTKYNTRQEGVSAAKSLAMQGCKLAEPTPKPKSKTGSDVGKTQRHGTNSPALPPTDLAPNGVHDRSSEPRPSPGKGAPSSGSVTSENPVARLTARRTKPIGAGIGPGSSEPKIRLPDLRQLETGNLSPDRTRGVKSQPPEAPRGPTMKTGISDDQPSASPITSIADEGAMSAGPTTTDSRQRKASASSGTNMTSEAATPSQPLINSPVSAVPAPMMVSASPKTSTDARPGKSGKTKLYEITKYTDATQTWERADREEACVKLCSSEDDKTVATSDERVSIIIDPQQCIKPQVQTIEGREGMSLVTLPQVSGDVISMVFDRSGGSKIELGKIQARNFMRWLQAQNTKLR